jgi:hypothetical protein
MQCNLTASATAEVKWRSKLAPIISIKADSDILIFTMGIHGAFSFFKSTFRDCIHSKRCRFGSPIPSQLPQGQVDPNVEFDNLYLDLNGAVHPVFCPRHGLPSGKTNIQLAQELYTKLDSIVASVRPRRLIYVALDGAAPLAKMNQQRRLRLDAIYPPFPPPILFTHIHSRRYRSAAENGSSSSSGGFDRNAITPGTDFMQWLSQSLRAWIEGKKRHVAQGGDAAWQNLSVVLSDSSVPGEGEHKIMDFIRSQQASPGHDENTRHCLVGKDGDFLMLGLAVGAKYFTILRETDEKESRGQGQSHASSWAAAGGASGPAAVALAVPSSVTPVTSAALAPPPGLSKAERSEWYKVHGLSPKEKKQLVAPGRADASAGTDEGQLALQFLVAHSSFFRLSFSASHCSMSSTPAEKLVKQLDYYFSDANWSKDTFMQQAADKDGYVSISVLSTFSVLFSPYAVRLFLILRFF